MRPFLLASLLNPESLLEKGGLLVLGLILFAESGLLIGFFLPGDSLLFVGGFLASDAGGNRLPALPSVAVVASSRRSLVISWASGLDAKPARHCSSVATVGCSSSST